MLTSAGVTAAGLTLLNHAVAQENVPGAEVADRSSSIRISAVKSYWVGSILYVKIETNHGISGWGDVKGVDPQFVQSLVASLAELIVGENPTRIEHLWQKLFRAHRDIRGGPFMVHSIAGLDIALWDISGKLWNVSVNRLLGGPPRERPYSGLSHSEGTQGAAARPLRAFRKPRRHRANGQRHQAGSRESRPRGDRHVRRSDG